MSNCPSVKFHQCQIGGSCRLLNPFTKISFRKFLQWLHNERVLHLAAISTIKFNLKLDNNVVRFLSVFLCNSWSNKLLTTTDLWVILYFWLKIHCNFGICHQKKIKEIKKNVLALKRSSIFSICISENFDQSFNFFQRPWEAMERKETVTQTHCLRRVSCFLLLFSSLHSKLYWTSQELIR